MNVGGGSWVVYACRSSYSGDVVEVVWRSGGGVHLMVDNIGGPDVYHSAIAPVVTLEGLSSADRDMSVVIPLITPGHRFVLEAEARSLGFDSFPPLLDPTSIVPRQVSIADGVVVNAGGAIGAQCSLGRFVSINRSVSIGHHGDIGDFATIGPGVVLAGHVTVGPGAFIGAGAVCAPMVTIGANAIVGAGAVVVRDLPAGAVAVGNPARVIRIDETGYGGVAVNANDA